ncbi:Uma2 family endonuclease [Nocardia sp. NBC_01503]|uniref:Uma2 family endonuclease n=1 Tax=Nocardia sp. NBC_01503 TaxID=2975997 RepID=UPI002E7C2FF6|nr:Uma2 family endonuclease [Nocardia sp. NBC_01503]WTL31598.1 Uma2 family endonuclease [Nocardia sp. NBC_01503]
MTASPREEPIPEWFRPPRGGWRAEDLDRLPPEAPRHLELLHGDLIVNAAQRSFHAHAVRTLHSALESQLPPGCHADSEMSVRIDTRNRPEPDILLVTSPPDPDRTYYDPWEVVLVGEVISEESEERDREIKPLKYAQAGIRHFWIIDQDKGFRPTVTTFALDRATGSYVRTGEYRDRLTVSEPYPLDIDFAAFDR